MNEILDQKDIDKLIEIAKQASKEILHYYKLDSREIEEKDDNSPVTIADKKSNEIILTGLASLSKVFPVVSEENDENDNIDIIKTNDIFWLIDPLDGTWSYIRRKGVFTINIALIKNGKPVFGLIYSPLHESCYYTRKKSVLKIVHNDKTIIQPFTDKHKRVFDFLVSSKQLNPETNEFLQKFHVATITSATSAYKFCMMLDDRGDIYPRNKNTYTWDTAAGHALLLALGGTICDFEGKELVYNTTELANPHFVAYRLKSFAN